MEPLIESPTGSVHQSGPHCAELRINCASYGPHGAGALMSYAITPSPCGRLLIAATAHGICWIGIDESAAYLEAEIRRDYPEAQVSRDDAIGAAYGRPIIAAVTDPSSTLDLALDIRATPFQLSVWQQLCAIPRGTTRSYGEIAQRLGRPQASRAVGHANGANPVAIIIPCHRAIGANGGLTGYRWGVGIKQRLLEAEGAIPQRGLAATG